MTAWEKQAHDYEQQSGDTISYATKLGVGLHHLPDASLREHLLLNSRSYDTYILMAAEIRTVCHGRNDVVRPITDGSECARDGCCLSYDRRKVNLRKTAGTTPSREVAKERMARKVKERVPLPRMATPRRKALVTSVTRLDGLLVNVRRRKQHTRRAPVVEAMCIAWRTRMIILSGS